VRRTVATPLVVATAVLMAVPVGASAVPPAVPAAPAAVEVPAVPAPPASVTPVEPAPMPAIEAPVVAAPAAPAAARPAVRSIRGRAPAPAGFVTDEAYGARLQAELCRARQIFCGLDHGGRYPGR
jgi:hypothetical protein